MEGLKAVPYIVLVIAIAGIIAGAAAVTLDKFQQTNTANGCFNSTFTIVGGSCKCSNNSKQDGGAIGEGATNMSSEGFAVCQSQQGVVDVAEQLPTVAIIGVMVIIISIIAGVFVYMRYFA